MISRGFIALTSVLVMSAVLMVLALGGSLAGFYSRVGTLDDEQKAMTQATAEACISHTLLTLARNPTYSGDATTTLGLHSCYTGPLTLSGTLPTRMYEFHVRSYIDESSTIYEITARESDLTVITRSELSTWEP